MEEDLSALNPFNSSAPDESDRDNQAVEYQENPCQESQDSHEESSNPEPGIPFHSFVGEGSPLEEDEEKEKEETGRRFVPIQNRESCLSKQ